jgi:hypothetical protein
MPKQDLNERYEYHQSAMGNAMREARALMDAGASVDATPMDVLKSIKAVEEALTIALYHTERMAVYDALRTGMRTANRDG